MKRDARLGVVTALVFTCSMALSEPAYAGGATRVALSCAGYNAQGGKTRAALATGYLEGVQAAVDKEMRDMLVPPDHQDHPIWWVLPQGELTTDRLETSLAAFCKAKANEEKRLAEAFLDIAAKKEGSPRIGLPMSDGPSEAWRTVLGKSRLRCSNYLSAADTERAHLVYGYFLGARAMNSILKTPPESSLMVWPDADHREVNARVDAACKGTRYTNSTIRDVLWLTTAEMGVEKRLAGAK